MFIIIYFFNFIYIHIHHKMNFQFNKALTNPKETFQVSFTEKEISKLTTIYNMMEDIELSPGDTDCVIPVPIDFLPDSIDLLKLILNLEEINKGCVKKVFTDYFQEKEFQMTKDTISSLLVFIDFMNIEENLENIIYDISAYYLINLSKKSLELSNS